jgi:hypothetical protein
MALLLTLGLWLQSGNPLPVSIPEECVTPAENKRLASEPSIDSRIKIYRQISERYAKSVQAAVSKSAFDDASGRLRCWKEILNASLKDIEANVNRKKKSGALKDYEIQLRKAVLTMGDLRLKVPYQRNEEFESWISDVTLIHKRFVDILFQR